MLIAEDASGRDVTLSLNIEAGPVAAAAVTVNGHALSNGSVQKDWISYPVTAEWIREGDNAIQVANSGPAGKAIVLKEVHVRLK